MKPLWHAGCCLFACGVELICVAHKNRHSEKEETALYSAVVTFDECKTKAFELSAAASWLNCDLKVSVFCNAANVTKPANEPFFFFKFCFHVQRNIYFITESNKSPEVIFFKKRERNLWPPTSKPPTSPPPAVTKQPAAAKHWSHSRSLLCKNSNKQRTLLWCRERINLPLSQINQPPLISLWPPYSKKKNVSGYIYVCHRVNPP